MKRTVLALLGLIGAVLAAATIWAWAPDTDPQAMKAAYGQEGRYAAAGDLSVHYRISGPADAPVLVLIHGTSASLHTWEPLRARLEDSYRVIAYDQPGHGLTGPNADRDYTYAGMAAALDAVMAAEGVERAVLIGNSMGGWVAWRHALARPDRVDGLVLIDPSGVQPVEEAEGNLGFALLQSPLGRAAMQRLTPRKAVEASLLQTTARDEIVTDEMIDRYWALLRYPGNRQAAGDQFTAERADLSNRLGEIAAPTLILWGEEDGLIPVSTASIFAERIPGAAIVTYPGVGHLPMEEAPNAVAEDIAAFLRANGLASR